MHYAHDTKLVKISDLYELAQSRRLTEIRNILSQFDTERLRKLAQLLSQEMKRLQGYRHNMVLLIQNEVCQILDTRQSDEAFARLLGGVA